MSLADLLKCICRERECREQGHVVWRNEGGKYVHVRVDGCLVSSSEVKKCDCFILYFPANSVKTIMFFVEVKSGNYSLDEVKEQIEKTVSLIESICSSIKDRVLVPVCYADRHPRRHERFISCYTVHSSKGPLQIRLLNFGEDLKKALK
jgi:hypothetical protein